MHSIKNISCSITAIRDKANRKSTKISEALFGEQFQVIKQTRFWSFGKLLKDEYEGWIINSILSEHIINTHKVCVPSTVLKEAPDIKSLDVSIIYLGSELKVLSLKNEWAKVLLPNNYTLKHSYVSIKHIQKISQSLSDWVQLSEKFIGTPYIWGGRGYAGIDCSGLVQICLQNSGIYCPRDSALQLKYFQNKNSDFNKVTRGMLVFWEGHVGIITSKNSILHSNAYHMSTVIESLETISVRMNHNNIKFLGIRNPNRINN